MGSLSQETNPPPLQLQDLKVKIQHKCLVYPAKTSERTSMFLSNIDQVLNFNVETVHFFQQNKHFPPHVVVEKLKTALANVLVTYDFLAGRLKSDPKTGRLEIDCNGDGVGFVVASSESSLDEIGDLVYPNPGFKDLIVKSFDDQPLCTIQVHFFVIITPVFLFLLVT